MGLFVDWRVAAGEKRVFSGGNEDWLGLFGNTRLEGLCEPGFGEGAVSARWLVCVAGKRWSCGPLCLNSEGILTYTKHKSTQIRGIFLSARDQVRRRQRCDLPFERGSTAMARRREGDAKEEGRSSAIVG